MGNLCGKQSQDNFAGPGRTLGSAPPQQDRASIPASKASAPQPAVSGAGRTVGGSGAASEGNDPKSAAAKAAEERAKKAEGTGALGKKLDAQKKQTRTQTLEQVAKENRGARDADNAAQARNWN